VLALRSLGEAVDYS